MFRIVIGDLEGCHWQYPTGRWITWSNEIQVSHSMELNSTRCCLLSIFRDKDFLWLFFLPTLTSLRSSIARNRFFDRITFSGAYLKIIFDLWSVSWHIIINLRTYTVAKYNSHIDFPVGYSSCLENSSHYLTFLLTEEVDDNRNLEPAYRKQLKLLSYCRM